MLASDNAAKLPIDARPSLLDVGALPFAVALLRANDGTVVLVNHLMSVILRCSEEKLKGKTIPGLYDNGQQRSAAFKLLKKSTFVPPKQIQITNFDNNTLTITAASSLIKHQNQLCILVAFQAPSTDATNVKRLRIAIERHNMALQAAQVGIWSWDLMSNRIAWDDTMHTLFGIKPGDFTGKQREFLEYMLPEDREEQVEIGKRYYQEGGKFDTKFRILRPDGETRVIINRGEATKNSQGIVISVVGVCWDVTENFALSAKIEHQALHDPLTGLLNRFEMQQRLDALIQSLSLDPTENTFCYFDLDRFKVVNDTCGHEAGDELLRQIAEHLKPYITEKDTFARMGGDEFALIMTNCSGDEARKVAETLLQAIQNFHFEWTGKVFDIDLSMALVPISPEKNVSEILGTADVALSAAKDGGRGRIHEYRPHDSTVIRRHDEMHWVLQLEDALRSDRFQLHFQPIMPLQNDSDEGLHYEVLLRVLDESGAPMSPVELLNAAEQFDMATRVDNWVVNAVFDWLIKHPDHLQKLSLCSINLSGASIGDPNFLVFLKEKLQDSQIPLQKISFEVTENAAIKNILKARDFIDTIKEYGCKFALDDFGSGHSSFAYLKDLPVDILKIDGMFVKGIHLEPVNYAMVKAINDVGQVMKMKTIAEYVENEEICNSLKEIGVDYGQGYYFGKSESLDEIIVVDATVATMAEIPG
jgi:diguanylate cyclase (GGDEF)-like protein/PAS domain S-box-containing protein